MTCGQTNPYVAPQATGDEDELQPHRTYVTRFAKKSAVRSALIVSGLSLAAWAYISVGTLVASYRHNVPLSDLVNWSDAIEGVLGTFGVIVGVAFWAGVIGAMFGLLVGLRKHRMRSGREPSQLLSGYRPSLFTNGSLEIPNLFLKLAGNALPH